jgi:hypothetical protein
LGTCSVMRPSSCICRIATVLTCRCLGAEVQVRDDLYKISSAGRFLRWICREAPWHGLVLFLGFGCHRLLVVQSVWAGEPS